MIFLCQRVLSCSLRFRHLHISMFVKTYFRDSTSCQWGNLLFKRKLNYSCAPRQVLTRREIHFHFFSFFVSLLFVIVRSVGSSQMRVQMYLLISFALSSSDLSQLHEDKLQDFNLYSLRKQIWFCIQFDDNYAKKGKTF